MIEDLRRKQGQAAVDALPFRLHWIYWVSNLKREKQNQPTNEELRRLRTEAEGLLKAKE
jgi:hypothetical protein